MIVLKVVATFCLATFCLASPATLTENEKQIIASKPCTLFKSSRIYTGQYTFQILLLNDDNMLGEHKGREKKFVYGRLF